MAVARSRIQDLLRVQCNIYNHSHNPELIKTGNKVLRQRLRGQALSSYYPSRPVTFSKFESMFPELEMFDEDEIQRLEDLAARKTRGKGAPKKKRTADDSKKFGKKK